MQCGTQQALHTENVTSRLVELIFGGMKAETEYGVSELNK